MAFRPLIAVVLFLPAVLRLAGAESATERLNGLLNNSPFGAARSNAAAGTGTGDPLEFRAVLEEDGKRFFSIYEASTRRSTWVEMSDPVNGFSVKAYDAAHDTVAVDFHGKSLSLPIKRAAPVAQTGLVPVPVAAANQPAPGGPSAIDQQRLQQIQEEIRRRRALRQQPSVPSGVVPGWNGGPQPLPVNPSEALAGPQPLPANPANPQQGPQPIVEPLKQ